ncbi:MAG: SDR family oxidoreductase [Candidatus Eisenbacteria bacterium]
MNLAGHRAVCLAASQGLGLGIATELALAGARTLLVSRSAEKLEAARARIAHVANEEGASFPGNTVPLPEVFAADLESETAPQEIFDEAVKRLGGVDILVSNIGGPPPGKFADMDDAAWQNGYDQLIRAYVRMFRAALPELEKSDCARVLAVTSVSSRQPIEGLVLSNTFRAGLVGLTKTLAQEYASKGILVNNLAPGMFDTDRLVELDQATARTKGIPIDEVRAQRKAQIPIGRYGDPRELGKVAAFLASPSNTMITGQTILVDGGLYKGL